MVSRPGDVVRLSTVLDDLQFFRVHPNCALGLSALSAGAITVGRLWMRPMVPTLAGYLSDWTSRQLVLAALLILGATLLLFGGLGISWSGAPVVGLVLVIGLITYGARGVFWATLADCDVPDRVKGLLPSGACLICYAPDVIQPLIEASLLGDSPSAGGYHVLSVGGHGCAARFRARALVTPKGSRQAT